MTASFVDLIWHCLLCFVLCAYSCDMRLGFSFCGGLSCGFLCRFCWLGNVSNWCVGC